MTLVTNGTDTESEGPREQMNCGVIDFALQTLYIPTHQQR